MKKAAALIYPAKVWGEEVARLTFGYFPWAPEKIIQHFEEEWADLFRREYAAWSWEGVEWAVQVFKKVYRATYKALRDELEKTL